MLTFVDRLAHGDAYPHAVGCLRTVCSSQVFTVGQFKAFEDDGVGAGNDVLRLTQIVLQDLTLILAQVSRFINAGAPVTCGEGKMAQRGDGKLRAAI